MVSHERINPAGTTVPLPATDGEPTLAAPQPAGMSVREQLAGSAAELQAIVDDGWRQYLALPQQVFDETMAPDVETLRRTLGQYDKVARDPRYAALTNRPEFRSTYTLLNEYVQQLSAQAPQVSLPPPPALQ